MIDDSMSQYKKALLYRKAQGKKMFNSYAGKIKSLFPSMDKPKIISLEETDVILDNFRAASVLLRIEVSQISSDNLYAELSLMKNYFGKHYVFIDADWKYCGLLLVENMEDINSNIKFGEKILNDIIFISANMSFAISFDFFEISNNYSIDIRKWQK